MPADSRQHKLDRVRRPRVQITYDVETNGAMQKIELPFVVGVLADLSGQPKEPLKPLKERKFVPTSTATTSTTCWPRSTPRVAMKVQNRLTDEDTKLGRRAELQAHRRLRAGPRRRAGRPPSRSCSRCGCSSRSC